MQHFVDFNLIRTVVYSVSLQLVVFNLVILAKITKIFQFHSILPALVPRLFYVCWNMKNKLQIERLYTCPRKSFC